LQKGRKSESSVIIISENSDSDTPKRVTRRGKEAEKGKTKEKKDVESENSEDSDFVPTKKAKVYGIGKIT
jgi:hypothetical protein